MAKSKKTGYRAIQIEDGKWYRQNGYTHTECCDCALIHKDEYRLVNGHLEWRSSRDDKMTEKRRQELGIKVVKKSV